VPAIVGAALLFMAIGQAVAALVEKPETVNVIAQVIYFPLMFLGNQFTDPYRRTNPLVVSLSRMYAPIARYRVRNLDVRLPFESRLVRSLGVFGRQG